MKSLMIVFGILGSLFATLPRAAAQNWTPTSAPSTNWSCVASSADGSKLVAAVNGGLIYTSTNSGAAWGATSAPATNWSSVACSADGTRLLAASGSALFISSDSGLNWVVTLDGYRLSVVMASADGTVLAAIQDGFIQISTNSGMAWAPVGLTLALGEAVTRGTCPADGRMLTLAGQDIVSTPALAFIECWTNTLTTGFFDNYTNQLGDLCDGCVFGQCAAIACSAEGAKVSAFVNNPSAADCAGQFWHSLDFGRTWVSNCMPVGTWTGLACSADGTRLAAVATGDAIYISTNSGLTWTPSIVPAANWSSIASSADGAKLVATIAGGGIYTCQTTPAPTLAVSRSGGTLVISWTVPSSSLVLRQNPDLTTTNWTEVPGTPVLDYSTLRNQVTIPAPPGTMFYRLVSP